LVKTVELPLLKMAVPLTTAVLVQNIVLRIEGLLLLWLNIPPPEVAELPEKVRLSGSDYFFC